MLVLAIKGNTSVTFTQIISNYPSRTPTVSQVIVEIETPFFANRNSFEY